MSEKSFGAFVQQAAKAGADKAQALVLYVRSRGATWVDVRNEISRSLAAGVITLERAERLLDFLDEAKACHESYGKEIDTARGDWVKLGDGCHMRKNHIGSNS
jgi:phosphoserine aminotransferase